MITCILHVTYNCICTCTLQAEKSIRGQKRFIVLEARNEGVRFTVASLRSLSDEYQGLQEQYNQTQDKFAKEVIEIASKYACTCIPYKWVFRE